MKKPVILAATTLLLASSLVACGRTETSSPTTPTDAVTSTNLPSLTTSPDVMQAIASNPVTAQQFIELAGRGNLYEIEAATIAQEKAQDPLLKSYAKQMIADHTQMAAAMNSKASLAGQQYTLPATLDSKHQAMIDQLNAASGAQFDQLYIQQMRQSHKDTYELLNAMADRGNESNFQEFASDYKQTVYNHLEQIDGIAEKVRM